MGVDLERTTRESRLATARALHVDRFTGEVVRCLRDSGVRPLLLKGPALAAWLYADGTARPYVDCDLLVAPDQEPAAAAVLASLGFERNRSADHLEPEFGPLHADTWKRERDGAEVDLHRALSGMRMGGSDVWGAMAERSETMKVGSAEVEVPGPAARALIVALHAVHHGSENPQPVADLDRAIALVPVTDWRGAVSLAERLHVVAPLALGLQLLPDGAKLAEELGLPPAEIAASAHSGAGIALGFDRLAGRHGVVAKLRLLLQEMFPSPRFMRWWSRLARHGPLGLALAYPWRVIYLLWHAVPGIRDYRRSR
jgi:hypothetical protein